ncbi:similar to TOXICOS EN LEVADURA 2 [Actinidia rufa]|uniref:Similar to TOXICOS EN LEVADURA 2 n=1 Tax=Actinidia rufa TaxID=165716 RepID=A0A7J0GWK2_9ERIC|nr:similar to TOXICOS EN LEVADURA 2 [Actinidia rufa]
MVVALEFPVLPNSRGRCSGSSHDWLAMADTSLSIKLVKPIRGGGPATLETAVSAGRARRGAELYGPTHTSP